MPKQITRKFDHEKGKLRDKASNPDYRERFQEECGRLEHGGTRGNRIVLAEMRNLGVVRGKIMAQDKEKAWLVFESRLRSLPLKDNGLTFSFKYSPTSFATANGLPHLPHRAKTPPGSPWRSARTAPYDERPLSCGGALGPRRARHDHRKDPH
jgi:hypothetical protein